MGNTPLLSLYFATRLEHPGIILLMRVGDFFEAYGDDAETIARDLEITLTGREDGGVRVPMAGVPHHACERYVARLIAKGRRVALMDQVEDPKLAKGLVKRRVTRVVTPGTVLEDSMLDARSNNYLVAAVLTDPVAGLGVVDVSTGEFLTTELEGERRISSLLDEIMRLEPAEVLVPDDAGEDLIEQIRASCAATITPFSPPGASMRRIASSRELLLSHFQTQSLRGFGCEEYTAGLDACALVLRYLEQTQASALAHIRSLSTYSARDYMVLDSAARRHLELTASMSDGRRQRTLLGVLDDTQTPMGGRMLRRWLEEPLLDPERIRQRQDGVEELAGDPIRRGDVRDLLKGMGDLERLVSRSAAGLANARDLVALGQGLQRLPQIESALLGAATAVRKDDGIRRAPNRGASAGDEPADPPTAGTPHPPPGPEGRSERLFDIGRRLSCPPVVADRIARALNDDPPASLREGGLIRPGYNAELDALRELAADAKSWIAAFETAERERTGINSLKVGYNAIFGYYIEVTRANLARVPANYTRKQTTAGGERYITEELKLREAQVRTADEKAVELEYELFLGVRERVADAAAEILGVTRALAELDVLCSFAETALRCRFVRPVVDDQDSIEIRGGRHPVIERLGVSGPYIPNDCLLDARCRMAVITGPNMSGKSSYLRQVALITLMAQIGSFVPADSATIGIVDRIFTRVGAHDELATGQSTFMVEMNETANILNNATPRSLVVLDEIGRGTSTYDGLSIAWAVAEYLVGVGCKTLFATHYHYLNDLAKSCPTVRNFRVAVKEQGDRIVWLRKLVPGGTDRSYGVQVARMAGIPPDVLSRAKEILKGLERSRAAGDRSSPNQSQAIATQTRKLQLTLFEAEPDPILQELETLDIGALTPIEALMKLDEWKRRLKP
jgi:DNA mismatch repair protein MutS